MWRKDRLVELRQKAGHSQEEFAKLANIPLVTYQRYEGGKNEPKVSTAALIAQKLNTTVAYLMEDTDEPARVRLVSELRSNEQRLIEAKKQGIDINAIKAFVAYLEGNN